MMLRKGAMVCMVVLLLSMASGEAIWSQESPGMASDGEIPSFHRGSGTEDDPYMIYDVYDLQAMNNDLNAHYALANDIDASETREWNWNETGERFEGFEPIGYGEWHQPDGHFKGSLYGMNHTITGLYINRRDTEYVGLFAHAGDGAVLKNLGLINNNITGGVSVGGFVGYSRLSSLSNLHTNGHVRGDEDVGGFVGRSYGSNISNSFSIGDVYGNNNVGGFLGSRSFGMVNNSYVTGNITGGSRMGGLIGDNSGGGSVLNSYVSGSINGDHIVGGLVGRHAWGSTVENSYSTANVWGNSGVGGLLGSVVGGRVSNSHYNIDEVLINDGHHLTIGGLYDEQYQDWFNNGLSLDISDYSDTIVPTGEHYEISEVEGIRDLLGFADVDRYKFILSDDIDLTIAPGLYIPYLAADFNGNNRTIHNLYIDLPFVEHLGMFGYAIAEEIVNIGLKNVSIHGGNYTGGLAGYYYGNGVISNSYVEGDIIGGSGLGGLIGMNYFGTVETSYVKGTVNGDRWVGGLVGVNIYGTVENSYATGSVDGDRLVGGLVGYLGHGEIFGSFSTGDVTGIDYVGGLVGSNWDRPVIDSYATGDVTGRDYVGGLIGWNYWNRINGPVSNTYATGDVTGVKFVGGLIGENWLYVDTSYATGNVVGDESVGGLIGKHTTLSLSDSYATGDVSGSMNVGGLVGWGSSSIYRTYSVGHVSGDEHVGGLIGYDGEWVYDSFWDVETSGQSESGGGEGKTTPEMMDITTFSDAGWDIATVDSTADRDIETIWNMVQAETYPFFSWKGLVLEVHITGNGKVDYDPPGHTYPHGTEVTLTATPDEGWYFSHWTGDVPEGEEENHEITMVMDGDKTLTAHFQRLYHTLTVNINGEGAIDPDVGTHTYLYGTEVTVIAVPAEGWYFNRWTGDVPSQQRFDPEITLVMDGDSSIRASFGLLNFQLNISVEGNGSTYPEEGINWYPYGTEVTVMAVPDQGWSFSHWTGDVPEAGDKGNETSLFMDGHKNLTAHFVLDEYTLNIKREGDGTTIPSEGGHTYLYGDEVNVTAAPDEGWRFSHWSGDVPPGMEHTENISILMDGNKSLTAHFESYLFAPDNLELMVTPLEGQPPLQITISVKGHNRGRREGSVDVLMDEELIYSLLIPGDSSAEYTFHHIFTEPGVYVIEFQGISETVVVEESSPSGSFFRLWMIPVAGIALVSLALIYYLYKNPMKSKPPKVYGPDELNIEVDETEDGFEELVDEI